MLIDTLKLCLVTQINLDPIEHYLNFLHEAILGGVSSVQFRDKSLSYSTKVKTAQILQTFLSSLNIPLIINDDVSLAMDIDAAGVHLGQSDIHPLDARRRLGTYKIIGWSIETYEQLERANELNCIDYIAASAIFPTQSKQNCKTIWGLEGLKNLSKYSKHPIVAIGGINKSNICDVIQHGATGVAVISAIHASPTPKLEASQLIQEISKGFQDVHTH